MTDKASVIEKLSIIEGGKEDLSVFMKRIEARLQSGDGGGTYGGMEARVAKLEASVSHIERDTTELRTDMRDVRDRLTVLQERVSHLPSKAFIVTSLLAMLAVIAGLITFQAQIQSYALSRPSGSSTQVPIARPDASSTQVPTQ